MSRGVLRVSTDSVALAKGVDKLIAELRAADYDVVEVGSLGFTALEPVIIDQDGNVYTGGSGPHNGGVSDVTVGQLLAGQTRLIFDRCGLHNPLDIDSYIESGGFSQYENVFEEIKASGLRGRGGAGFPAHIQVEYGTKC